MVRNRPAQLRNCRGFTLVEVLVVGGIILILASLLIPAAMRSMRQSRATRTAMDLQTIAVALEQYKTDHGDYPRIDLTAPTAGSNPTTSVDYAGAITLCRALVAPGPALASTGYGYDGADGPGFRTRVIGATPQGTVHGPYIKAEAFNIGLPDGTEFDPDDPEYDLATLRDAERKPILYFAARPVKPDISAAGGYVLDEKSLYNANQNIVSFKQNGETVGDPNALLRIRAMLGDDDADGAIGPGETAKTLAPFLLWAAGPDKLYGPTEPITADMVENRQAVEDCDDITNFNQ